MFMYCFRPSRSGFHTRCVYGRFFRAARFRDISNGFRSTIAVMNRQMPVLSSIDIPKPPPDAILPCPIVPQSLNPSSCLLLSWDPSIQVWTSGACLLDNSRGRARSSRAQISLICVDALKYLVFRVCSRHAPGIAYL